MRRLLDLSLVLVTLLSHSAFSAVYTVDPAGSDRNPGSAELPFRTISKAAAVMRAGDKCHIRAGVYRESVVLQRSGTEDNPIQFIGAVNKDGRPLVTIDGTEPVSSDWQEVTVNGIRVFAASLPRSTIQVFHNDRLMVEARWPDQPFSRIWDRSTWAKGDKGGYKGKMISNDIADTNIDWTGALAVLNVGHQFKTWVREVRDHKAGSGEFSYTLDERMGNDKEDGATWWDDRFYLIGRIDALTSPEEWFYDEANRRLLFFPPEGRKPGPGAVKVKRRDYGISGEGIEHVRISGIQFFGCTLNFSSSNHLVIEKTSILYPNFSRLLNATLPAEIMDEEVETAISGENNVVRHVWIAYGNTTGIRLSGRFNRIEDSVIHDICWNGNINYPGVMVNATTSESCDSAVSRCTIYNSGNVGILYRNRSNLIEYNHVYNTGLACKDIAAIHTGSPEAAGSVTCYNWVHDSMGKGIRGDDQTRGLTFHHNVVWNCDEGMILKGDFNKCYNNTVVGNGGHGCLIIPTRPEPQKWWAKNAFLEVQNANSIFCNNLVEAIVYRYDPLPGGQGISHNVELSGKEYLARLVSSFTSGKVGFLVNPDIVDIGRFIPDCDIPFSGQQPDIGAYESGGEPWKAGASWKPPSLGFDLEINAEVARSWEIQTSSRNQSSIPLPAKIRESRMNPLSKDKLQQLFDNCWTPEEIQQRRDFIQERKTHPEGSAGYEELQKEVSRLHRQANERLAERAGEVLFGSELILFYDILK